MIKDPKDSKAPDLVWLPESDPSPAASADAIRKLATVPKHRGLVLCPKGPGTRAAPAKFAK